MTDTPPKTLLDAVRQVKQEAVKHAEREGVDFAFAFINESLAIILENAQRGDYDG